jgi:CheY-like chemotaxis protein
MELSREHIFDMNLIDYHMPGRKENVVCSILRQHNPDVFVIGFFKNTLKTKAIRRYKRRILIIRNN